MTDANTERDHWNTKATMTDPMFEMWADKPNTVQCINLLLEDLDPRDAVKAKILDLGCGVGRLSQAVQDRFPTAKVYGVDSSPKLLELAGSLADLSQQTIRPTYLLCDGRSLPDELPTDIDYAYSMVVFQHIPNEAKAAYIKSVYDHLRVGGAFRFQVVEGDEQSDYNHHISQVELVQMCEAVGFDVQVVDSKLMYKNWLWLTAVKVPTE